MDYCSIRNLFEGIEDFESSVCLHDSINDENRLAVISQFLHNPTSSLTRLQKIRIIRAIVDYLKQKKEVEGCIESYENVLDFANDSGAMEYFSDFLNVPFPNPQKSEFAFVDLFAGIGGIRMPFTELGYRCVFSSEWDKYAQKTYLANYGEMPFGDICKESTKSFIPERFDLLLAGFPCQAFSIMGKMKGFGDTRGTLFFEVASILKRHKPRVFLLENVKQLTTHDGGRTFAVIRNTLEELGYYFKWEILNAMNFGLPQKRERVIIVGFRDKKMADEFDFEFERKKYDLKEILEDDSLVDSSLFASEMIYQKRLDSTRNKKVFYPSIWHENKSGNISILDYACALRTGASYNYLLVNGRRRPSSRELLRLQGFPDKFRIAVSHGEIRKQTGNSVAVPMIREVAKKIDLILKRNINNETSKTAR